MARYNTASAATKKIGRSPVKTVAGKTARTHEGGIGFVNDEKGELFRLGVNLFAGGEDKFYESGKNRDNRFADLVSNLAVSDSDWTFNFLKWLRSEGNIRTASILGAMHAMHARLEKNISGGNRRFAAEIPHRLDEVGEMFAIYASEFGKPFPQALKRGAGDALGRLANEYSVMKYDTDSHAWRIADILGIAHVSPNSAKQNALFNFAVASRYGNDFKIPAELLPKIDANIKLREKAKKNPSVLLDPDALNAAGMTWEDVLSLAGNTVNKKKLWEALIDAEAIGYMAMLRNLRNFEQAGISKSYVTAVCDKISDPVQVAKSRQFPFRFWSAYKNAKGSQWVHALETALDFSAQNVPVLDGRTDVLIDTSGSMACRVSNKGTIRCDEVAAVFAASLAIKNAGNVDMYMFADRVAEVKTHKGGSVLRTVDEVCRRNGEVGFGTQTTDAVRRTYKNHDRVMIFTDGQSFGSYYGDPSSQVPSDKFVYAWDLAGYKTMDVPSGQGTRHQLGGLTDGTFKMIPLLERGRNAQWPWEM